MSRINLYFLFSLIFCPPTMNEEDLSRYVRSCKLFYNIIILFGPEINPPLGYLIFVMHIHLING